MIIHSKKLFLCLLSFVVLTACENNIQTSSGKEYLARHENTSVPASEMEAKFQARLRDAANIEPTLKFPARIGVARIEKGELSDIPVSEMKSWGKASEKIGSIYGEFVPLSVILTRMTEVKNSYYNSEQQYDNTIQSIRLAAARQHIDVVFIYEVKSKGSKEGNFLSLGNLTLVGAFILPSEEVKAEAISAGMLVDVMNGYPYGQVKAVATKSALTTWHNDDVAANSVSEKARLLAVENLASEVDKMLFSLKARLEKKSSNKINP